MNVNTEYRLLKGLYIKIHNPQVAMAYESQPVLRSGCIIRSNDNFSVMLLKVAFFYLVCGRINSAATVPMYWATKIDRSLRQQLAIAYRPTERRRFKFGKYDRNTQLHIPHYVGGQRPKIPSYTVGQHSAKLILTDQSSILVHASSPDEAVEVVKALAAYVDPKFLPKAITISTTTRRGKALSLSGQKVRPFRADYYPPGVQTPEWSVQL
jgi:hypothetical protein